MSDFPDNGYKMISSSIAEVLSVDRDVTAGKVAGVFPYRTLISSLGNYASNAWPFVDVLLEMPGISNVQSENGLSKARIDVYARYVNIFSPTNPQSSSGGSSEPEPSSGQEHGLLFTFSVTENETSRIIHLEQDIPISEGWIEFYFCPHHCTVKSGAKIYVRKKSAGPKQND